MLCNKVLLSNQRSDNTLEFAFAALVHFWAMALFASLRIGLWWSSAWGVLHYTTQLSFIRPLSLMVCFLNELSMLRNHRHRPATLHTDEQNTYSTHTATTCPPCHSADRQACAGSHMLAVAMATQTNWALQCVWRGSADDTHTHHIRHKDTHPKG